MSKFGVTRVRTDEKGIIDVIHVRRYTTIGDDGALGVTDLSDPESVDLEQLARMLKTEDELFALHFDESSGKYYQGDRIQLRRSAAGLHAVSVSADGIETGDLIRLPELL